MPACRDCFLSFSLYSAYSVVDSPSVVFRCITILSLQNLWFMSTNLIYEEESYKIRGACFEVYREKGCGFLEPVYQECMELELRLQGILFVPKRPLALEYKGTPLRSTYEPD